MLLLNKLFYALVFVVYLTSCSLFQNQSKQHLIKREIASVKFESYLERPDILDIKAQEHPNLMTQWIDLKRAHIEAVAIYLEMYPDREIYFLARDSELLYDVARLALRDEPERLKKVHLLNISRANMRAMNVEKYLAQEGISTEALEAGKKILFIDTGFNGTIPRVLKDYFPAKYHEQIKTHLICSSNPQHPSTSSFLVWLNSEVINMSPGNMHGTIIGYEHMQRYTDRSSQFENFQGRWHPMSTATNTSFDGLVSKDVAQKYMEDLKSYFEKKEVQEIFIKRREFWRKIYNSPDEDLGNFLKKTLTLTGQADKKVVLSAIVDLNEMGKGNLNLEDFGILKKITSSSDLSNKNEMIKKFPEWKSILENPDDGIKKLFKTNDLITLGKIIDTVNDFEIMQEIIMRASKNNDTFNTQIFDLIISKKSKQIFHHLAQHTFSQPHTKDMTTQLTMLIKGAIESFDADTLFLLAKYTFSEQHTRKMFDPLALLIKGAVELKNSEVLRRVAYHSSTMSQNSGLLIEKKAIEKFFEHQEWEILENTLYGTDKAASIVKINFTVDEVEKNIKNIIEINQQRKIKVVSFVDQGKRGSVYKVEDAEYNKMYALKIAKNQEIETLDSFAKEKLKDNIYKKYGVPHASIIESSSNMILKEWIEGVRADDFFKNWSSTGASQSAPELIAFKKFFYKLAESGIYIGDLNAKNLIWSKGKWIIVDSGGIKEGLTHDKALSEYLKKIPLKMEKHLSPSCLSTFNNFFED